MRNIENYDYIRGLIRVYEGKNLQVTKEDNSIIISFLGNEGGNEVIITATAPYTSELYSALIRYANHGF